MSPVIEVSQGKAFQLDDIAAIADAVALRSAGDLQRGFLLGSADAAELLSLIKSREIWVAGFAGATVGFIVAHTDASQRFGAFRNRIPEIRWSAAPDFLDSPAVYVDRIAARPGYQGHGVGRALYEALFQQYPSHGFFAGVAESPMHNGASVRFHDRLGFRRVGTYGPVRLGGVDDYVGGVFYRAPI
jgi:ribosomal protein S18 acetylase RimI-like enzyme